MADNFNLRSFLSENKLTKNAQLLKEEAGEGEVNEAKEYSFTFNYNTDEDDVEYIQNILMNAGVDAIAEPGIDSEEMVVKALNAVELRRARKAVEADGFEVNENIDEASYSDSYDTPAAKKVHGQLRDIVNIFDKSRSEEEQEVEAAIQAAEQETGSQVTPTEKSVLLQQARWIRTHDMEMERESVDNKKPMMKETKLTIKERRLVEMVNNAMGMQEEENVDYTMGRQDDPNQLPNPAPELNIPEGEEMVQEKPMPKYSSIEELMKEIEHGTNEAAHKYKMEEMKRIYELLETKVSSLEEGENAEHIDQSKVKQMRKDIAALRKAEEKLRKEFEKKFTGKEKKENPKKEEAAAALQEGFDLRKFLVENKLTKGSRILKEQSEVSKEEFIRGLAAELKQQGFSNVSEILNDKTGMGSFDQGAWYVNTSDSMLDDEVIEEVEPIIYNYCDEKGVEVVA
jgi:hypothetical protein